MVIPEDQLQQLIIKHKLLTEPQLAEFSDFAKNANMSLSEALISKDIISDASLGLIISDHLKIPFVILTKLTIPQEIIHVIPERIARKQKVIPFERTPEGLKLAMIDPHNTVLTQMLEKKVGQKIIPYLITERDFYNSLALYRKDLAEVFENLHIEEDESLSANNEAPISKIVDLFVSYAYQDKASDIHIEPQEKNLLVRFRIDGILHDVLYLPKPLLDRIVTRIKILSRLRTDEHLSPQDGKFEIKLDEEVLDIRVSIIPMVDGEKVVLRLLASHLRQYTLLDLGMSEKDLKKVQVAASKSYGMILSTGPTGSGKTTSIYSILKILNTRDKNITTIEDPVEYRIQGVNQIQTNVKANLTFASGLRSILRQDPNTIFVGEIRDGETAGIAVNAALTGHLVLSTLHTNDAATALPRLTDMQIEPFLVASTVNIIIAQRLVRKICNLCKVQSTTSLSALSARIPHDALNRNFSNTLEIKLYKGSGCKVCRGTGYSGRAGVFEILEVTPAIKKLITEKHDSDIIAKQAIADGMTTMLDDGLVKASHGITTIEEVLRVTKVEST